MRGDRGEDGGEGDAVRGRPVRRHDVSVCCSGPEAGAGVGVACRHLTVSFSLAQQAHARRPVRPRIQLPIRRPRNASGPPPP